MVVEVARRTTSERVTIGNDLDCSKGVHIKSRMFRRIRNQVPPSDHHHNLLCKSILLAALLVISLKRDEFAHCQLAAGSNATSFAASVANATSSPNPKSGDKDEAGELILSSDEFVDSREVPLILFDGTSNEESVSNSTRQANVITTNKTTSSNSSHLPLAKIQDKRVKLNETSTTTITTTTTIANKLDDQANSDKEENADDVENETEAPNSMDDSMPNTSNADRAFEPPQSIAQYMDYIEKLFHDLRHQIAQLFEPHLPQLIRTSQMVELSSSCSYDMLRMALALRQFEPWALRMIDSSGKVPEGIFEGSFTALGSYDECLSTVFQSSSQDSSQSQQQQQQQQQAAVQPTQGQYCLVTVSPFMPPKPPADRVDRLFQEEANRRNYTRDDQFSRLSPMFYYMKFRIGVCIPSSCDQDDMSSISSALSSSLRLNITIPDCRIKQPEQHLTRAQLIGGLLFASVVVLVLFATLADCFKLKWKQLEDQDLEFLQQGIKQDDQQKHTSGDGAMSVVKIGLVDHMKPAANSIDIHGQQQCYGADGRRQFIRRLAKHWTWMSFSLIANFRLYFSGVSATANETKGDHRAGRQQAAAATCRQISPVETVVAAQNQEATQQHQMIACLNGIRVLSLCWIIVANSYLTLDPRATKRLTKTREAPRDFLFQLVIQASLAIETFFFLSGLLMSLSFARHLKPPSSMSSLENTKISHMNSANGDRKLSINTLKWLQFYVHRYIRITPPTMLVIAFSMYAYHFGDGPLWFEATARVHQSCSRNWWRHLLHVANFIDTRQMCFIHYWYIAADMQLFLLGPLIMWLLYKSRRLGYLLISSLGLVSMALVFYITYTRQLPPTLLFYNTESESRREFGNTIMTKPFTHALPYLVGVLVGWLCFIGPQNGAGFAAAAAPGNGLNLNPGRLKANAIRSNLFSATGLLGSLAITVALVELFLPYKWNNSHLPSPLAGSVYAALFRLGWSLVLAYVVISCGHQVSRQCEPAANRAHAKEQSGGTGPCYCSSGGNYLNKLLGLTIFKHLSKLSFVAYLVHLPLMSAFIGQTRGLFAFSHTLVLHFAVSYLVISFALALVLVHFIEFPFITFERLLFESLFKYLKRRLTADFEQGLKQQHQQQQQHQPKANTLEAHEKYLLFEDPRSRSTIRSRANFHQDTKNSAGVRHDLALTLEQTNGKMGHANNGFESAQMSAVAATQNERLDFIQRQHQNTFVSERL